MSSKNWFIQMLTDRASSLSGINQRNTAEDDSPTVSYINCWLYPICSLWAEYLMILFYALIKGVAFGIFTYLSSHLIRITLSVPIPKAAAPFFTEKWLWKNTFYYYLLFLLLFLIQFSIKHYSLASPSARCSTQAVILVIDFFETDHCNFRLHKGSLQLIRETATTLI